MAEEEGQEKTEQATSGKKQKAREKGEVPKSKDLTSTMGLVALLVFFFLFGANTLSQGKMVFSNYFNNCGRIVLSEAGLHVVAREAMSSLLIIMLPPVVTAMLVALLAHMVQVGFLFSAEPLTPKLEKLDPISGFKKIFSFQSLAETLKGVFKVITLVYILKGVLESKIPEMADIPFLSITDIARVMFETLWLVLLVGMLAYLVFAVADYAFQVWDFVRKQRMSRQEIKEENKEQEGDPMIRARVRSIQKEMARKRMMADVPEATVVLTNPTHIAVAIKYTPEMSAPRVVAKGAGWLAEKIKETARQAGVPVMENKPLARALHKLNLGEEISEDMYKSVAQVLAYVYGKKRPGNQPVQAPA